MAKNSLILLAPLIRGVARSAGGFGADNKGTENKTPRSLHSRPPYQGVSTKIHPASSAISQRTRTIATAMLYIQKASAMSSMPVSMVAAIDGAWVKLTDAPWCSVFHHCTE